MIQFSSSHLNGPIFHRIFIIVSRMTCILKFFAKMTCILNCFVKSFLCKSLSLKTLVGIGNHVAPGFRIQCFNLSHQTSANFSRAAYRRNRNNETSFCLKIWIAFAIEKPITPLPQLWMHFILLNISMIQKMLHSDFLTKIYCVFLEDSLSFDASRTLELLGIERLKFTVVYFSFSISRATLSLPAMN